MTSMNERSIHEEEAPPNPAVFLNTTAHGARFIMKEFMNSK